MKRIVAVSLIALGLAGCNATVRPAVDVYVPAPTPRPYYEERTRLVLPPAPRYRCASVWDRTPYGYVERKVCGNHIP